MRALTVSVSILIASLLGAGAARADEAGATGTAAATRLHVAMAVNNPLSWTDGGAFGASLYLGIGEHHAIRGNVARYDYRSSTVGTLLAVAAGGDGEEASYSGDTSDVGIGWVYYLRGPWSGWTFELGVLRRARDHRRHDDNASPEIVETRTTTYAGRALVGWAWLLSNHVFLAVSAGFSAGREAGTEKTESYLEDMTVRTHVSRSDAQVEGLLRIGVAFDP